jgi:hypothetical protein
MAQRDVELVTGQAIAVSELGKRVIDLVGDLVDGIYHYGEWLSADWGNDRHIALRWSRDIATFDNSLLTKLVFLAHDRALRVEINPKSNKNIELVFHARSHTATRMWERHPTLEQAVEKHRGLKTFTVIHTTPDGATVFHVHATSKPTTGEIVEYIRGTKFGDNEENATFDYDEDYVDVYEVKTPVAVINIPRA